MKAKTNERKPASKKEAEKQEELAKKGAEKEKVNKIERPKKRKSIKHG